MSVNLNRDDGPRGRDSFDGLDRGDTVHVIRPGGSVAPVMFCSAGEEVARVMEFNADGNPTEPLNVYPSDLLHPDEDPEEI